MEGDGVCAVCLLPSAQLQLAAPLWDRLVHQPISKHAFVPTNRLVPPLPMSDRLSPNAVPEALHYSNRICAWQSGECPPFNVNLLAFTPTRDKEREE